MEAERELADCKTLCYSLLVLCLIWGLFCIPTPPGLFLSTNPLSCQRQQSHWKKEESFPESTLLLSLIGHCLHCLKGHFISLSLIVPLNTVLIFIGLLGLVVGSIVCLKYSHHYIGTWESQKLRWLHCVDVQ